MTTLVLLAALSFPNPGQTGSANENSPIVPEQVLAWQLEGLTQEEIQDEVRSRGLTEYLEIPLLSALSAAGADHETIRTLRTSGAPRKIWKLGLRLPGPTDYLYEIAGAILWNDQEAALLAIENAAEKQAGNANVHLIYANLARYQGDWIRAYGEATKAVQLAPDSPYAHGLRSTICYHSRLVQCALREADVFVGMRPQDAGAYIVLGHALELQGDYPESLAAYKKAERLHSGYSAIYEGMGRAYGMTGGFEQALTAFERAIELEKGNAPEYSCELAELYLAEGYARKAVDTLRKAKEQTPDRLNVRLTLGKAYLADEQYPAAIHEYREILQLAPDLEIARAGLETALRADGRMEEAEQTHGEVAEPPRTRMQR